MCDSGVLSGLATEWGILTWGAYVRSPFLDLCVIPLTLVHPVSDTITSRHASLLIVCNPLQCFSNLDVRYHSSSSSVCQVFSLLHSFLTVCDQFRNPDAIHSLNTCPNHLRLLFLMIIMINSYFFNLDCFLTSSFATLFR